MTTQISDSAADIQANIDTLQSEVTAGQVTSITLTDANTPTLTLTAAQFSNDTGVLNAITGSYDINVTGVSALSAQVPFLNPHVTAVSVTDSGLNIGLDLDVLESLAKAGTLLSITVTGGTDLTVTQAQLTNDADALAKVTSSVGFVFAAPAAGGAVTGVAEHANTVDFTGLVSQFTFTASSDGQSLTVSSSAGAVQLSNVQGLHFTDGTQLVVAQPPGDANHVNTGNVTELYSAVLAREPDLGGLAFYQNFLASNPSTPLQTFADYFLNSTEYKSAHSYTADTAGDTQFIEDSYQNLLHRTPTASEVAFYTDNVMTKAETGLAAGSTAFANAQFQAHALMLVYFSASSEFLTDVQVTATNTASAQHWLVLA